VAGTPGKVVEHCRAVAAVGRALALAVAPHVNELDASLVEIGCLLHDLTRLQPHHARLAEELLTNLGLPHLGEIVGQHMVIRPQEPRRPEPTEAELVYLADKLVADDAIVGLAERQARALRNVGPEATAAQRIRDRVADARLIAQKVTAVTGRPLEDILSEAMMQSGQEAMRQNGARRRGAQGDLEVFLVRHPESAGQNRKRFLGRADPDLGADGERQAEQLAGTLMEITGGVCFDAIYTSDLRRCLRTAQIVARGCRTPVQAVPWLREIDVGLWEGLSRDEAKRDFPQEHRRREHDLTGEPFPGGESFKDLQDRVMPPLLRLLDDALEAGRRRVLIVGHKGVNRVILARVLRLPLEALFSIEQDYSGIAIVRVDKDPGDGLRFSLVRRS
jgi:alpha-ribazole phosphatase